MDKIKVSILVPAYNVEAYLDECLQSLLSQTLKEIEIVVVDDGSSDRTATIAEQYAASDSRIRVIRLPEHQGVSHARNACLAEAQGEYLSFVDSDDTISSTAMEELYHKAKTTDVDIALGSMLYCYPDGRQIRISNKSDIFHSEYEVISGIESFMRMQRMGTYVPMVCGNLYRTAFIRKHSELHFEGEFHEDDYFTPYTLFFAGKTACVKKNIYYYRQRKGSIMNRHDNIKQRALSLSFSGLSLDKFISNPNITLDENIRMALLCQIYHLQQRAKQLYEDEMSTSLRKCVFILTENGNNTNVLTSFLDFIGNKADWDVNVLTTHVNNIQEVMFRIVDGVAWYDFPLTKQGDSFSDENRYLKSIFYYWISCIHNNGRKLYCFYSVNQYYLGTLFREQLQLDVFQQYDKNHNNIYLDDETSLMENPYYININK